MALPITARRGDTGGLCLRQQLMEYIDQVAKAEGEQAAMVALQEANEYLVASGKPAIERSEIFDDEVEE